MDQTLALRAIAALLAYPEEGLKAAIDEIAAVFDPAARASLAGLIERFRQEPLIRLQEAYVDTFDRTASHSLHLFEHIHGESRERGQAMVDLLAEYRRAGFEPDPGELPDHLPAFVELLSVLDEAQRTALLDDAVHVLAAIGGRLRDKASPYAGLFEILIAQARVSPQPLQSAPVRDMDEALEMFGPSPDGVEPLLKPADSQIMQFHRKPDAAAIAGAGRI